MRYSTSMELGGTKQATATTYKTGLALTAEATGTITLANIYEILFGTDGTPADNVLVYDISRITAAGTATAVTPNPLVAGGKASTTAADANFTAEGTITANSSVFSQGVNQRAAIRWVANPGSELWIPATDEAGFAFRFKSPAYTGTVTITAFHEE